MRKSFWIGLILVCAWACFETEHAPGPSVIYPTDTDDADIEEDAGQDDTDTGDDDTDFGVPEISDAEIVHSPPTFSQCERLDDGTGGYPSLFSHGDKWYAFFTEGEDVQTAPMRLRVSDAADLDFGEPVTLLYGAKEMDFIRDGDRFLALAARMLYAVLLESDDGVEWRELGNIAPDEPPYWCDGYPPVRFFRSSGAVEFLAMGHDYNTGVFGCVERLFFACKRAGVWEVPAQIGDGDAVFAYQAAERLLVVSTFGVYFSTDNGSSFHEISGGDTTASQIRATGATVVNGRIILAQSYNWANEYVIALVMSDDDGATWTKRIALDRSGTVSYSPVIASSGDFVAVAWFSSGSAWVMTSPDGTETWSAPVAFADPDSDSALSSFSLAAAHSLVGLSFKTEGVKMCLGQAGQ